MCLILNTVNGYGYEYGYTMYGYATPFWRHFQVVFDHVYLRLLIVFDHVRVVDLYLSTVKLSRLWKNTGTSCSRARQVSKKFSTFPNVTLAALMNFQFSLFDCITVLCVTHVSYILKLFQTQKLPLLEHTFCTYVRKNGQHVPVSDNRELYASDAFLITRMRTGSRLNRYGWRVWQLTAILV